MENLKRVAEKLKEEIRKRIIEDYGKDILEKIADLICDEFMELFGWRIERIDDEEKKDVKKFIESVIDDLFDHEITSYWDISDKMMEYLADVVGEIVEKFFSEEGRSGVCNVLSKFREKR